MFRKRRPGSAAALLAGSLGLLSAALVPGAGCPKRAPPPAPVAAPAEGRFDRGRLSPLLLEACDRFRALRGKNRIAEARLLFPTVFPKFNVIERKPGDFVVRAEDQAFTMSRRDVTDLLGAPSSGKANEMVYPLGSEGGEAHFIQVFLRDDKVVLAITSLDAR
jgi:hypothetical protein